MPLPRRARRPASISSPSTTTSWCRRASTRKYPYNPEGKWSGGEGHCFDQLATLAFLASCTERMQLLTAVMVVPHRHPVLAAKMLSTIDVLSEGRLLLGVGAGWLKEEFDILGAPFAGRGRATDEYIEAFKELWSKERPAYNGEFVKFDNVLFAPKPVQKDKVPIWVGGESGPAMRRVVKLGDVWYPGSNSRDPLLDTPERIGAAIAKLADMAKAAGRDPKTIETRITSTIPISMVVGMLIRVSTSHFTLSRRIRRWRIHGSRNTLSRRVRPADQ